MSWSGEIHPATLEQVHQGRGGRMVTIDNDVAGIAADLKRIDKRLCLRWSEKGQFFCVYTREENEPEGTGHLVGTFQELDQRIVRRIEELYWKWRQPGFSFADEMDAEEDRKRAEADREFSEKIAENAEKLAWALRKDLGLNGHRAFMPEGLIDE